MKCVVWWLFLLMLTIAYILSKTTKLLFTTVFNRLKLGIFCLNLLKKKGTEKYTHRKRVCKEKKDTNFTLNLILTHQKYREKLPKRQQILNKHKRTIRHLIAILIACSNKWRPILKFYVIQSLIFIDITICILGKSS